MPKPLANNRQSSAALSDTSVFNTASAFPACESKPAEREYEDVESWASASISSMLSRVKVVCITEYQWMIDELLAQ